MSVKLAAVDPEGSDHGQLIAIEPFPSCRRRARFGCKLGRKPAPPEKRRVGKTYRVLPGTAAEIERQAKAAGVMAGAIIDAWFEAARNRQ